MEYAAHIALGLDALDEEGRKAFLRDMVCGRTACYHSHHNYREIPTSRAMVWCSYCIRTISVVRYRAVPARPGNRAADGQGMHIGGRHLRASTGWTTVAPLPAEEGAAAAVEADRSPGGIADDGPVADRAHPDPRARHANASQCPSAREDAQRHVAVPARSYPSARFHRRRRIDPVRIPPVKAFTRG